MPEPQTERVLREVVGVLPNPAAVARAVQELLTEGFDQADVSLLAGDESVRDALGAAYCDIGTAADDPSAPRQGYAAPEARTEIRGALAGILGYAGAVAAGGLTIATGGAAGVVIAAALLGGAASGGLGVALGQVLDRRVAAPVHEHLQRGGVLVFVKIDDTAQETTAKAVLAHHGAHEVHVHSLVMNEGEPDQSQGHAA